MLMALGAVAQPLAKYDNGSKKYFFMEEGGTKLTEPIYDYAGSFIERDRVAVKKDGKWFFINSSMETITPQVDSIDMAFQTLFDNYLENLEVLKKECCFYFFDIKKQKASPGFASINNDYLAEFYSYGTIIVNTKSNKLAFVDINKFTISPEYDSFFFDPYYYGMFDEYWMKKDGKIYRTNKSGIQIQEFDYVDEIDLMNYETSFSFKKNGLWNLMIKDKALIKYEVTDENYFGMPWNEQYIFKVGDKTYFKDGLYGKLLLDVKTFPRVDGQETSDDHISDLIYYNNDLPIRFKREKFGFMDLQLNIVIPATLDSAYEFDNAKHAVVKKGNTWSVIDFNGKTIIESTYELIIPTRDTSAFIAKIHGQYGLISQNGEIKLPFENGNIEEVNLGYIVQKNGKFGLLGSSLSPIIDYKYDDLTEMKDYYLLFRKGNQQGIYDVRSSRELFSGNYKTIEMVPGQNYLFHDGQDKLGELLSFSGDVLISGNYDGFSDLGNGFIALKTYNNTTYSYKYQIYNLNSKTMLPGEYEDVSMYSDNLASVKFNGKYGFINEKGELVIPAIYGYAGKFSNGTASVKLGKRYTYIDKSGNEIKNKK